MITASHVELVWNSAEPSAHVKQLVLQYVAQEGEAQKTDLQKWDELEMRFEAGELDWIADYILNNLVFCKS